MTPYAYLRVSTDTQDVENQKLGVLEYCARQGMGSPKLIEDTVSGQKSWRERKIGQLIERAQPGDVIVAAEVSRLARSTLQVLELLQRAAEQELSVHIAKNQLVMDGSMPATITATILGLAAQIEREFISVRTKEALAQRKAKGLPLGRPRGPAKHLKLDPHREEIVGYLKKGASKRSVARIVACSPSALYDWIKRHKITVRPQASP